MSSDPNAFDSSELPDSVEIEVTSNGQGENIQVGLLEAYDNGKTATNNLNTCLSGDHDAAAQCYNTLDESVFKGPAATTSREGIDKFTKTISNVLIPTYTDIINLLGNLKTNNIEHDNKAFQTVSSAFEDRASKLPEIGEKGPAEIELLTTDIAENSEEIEATVIEAPVEEESEPLDEWEAWLQEYNQEAREKTAFLAQLQSSTEDTPAPLSRIDQTFAKQPIENQLRILSEHMTDTQYEQLVNQVTSQAFGEITPSRELAGNYLHFNPATKAFDQEYNLLEDGASFQDFAKLDLARQILILQYIYNQQPRIEFPTQ